MRGRVSSSPHYFPKSSWVDFFYSKRSLNGVAFSYQAVRNWQFSHLILLGYLLTEEAWAQPPPYCGCLENPALPRAANSAASLGVPPSFSKLGGFFPYIRCVCVLAETSCLSECLAKMICVELFWDPRGGNGSQALQYFKPYHSTTKINMLQHLC